MAALVYDKIIFEKKNAAIIGVDDNGMHTI